MPALPKTPASEAPLASNVRLTPEIFALRAEVGGLQGVAARGGGARPTGGGMRGGGARPAGAACAVAVEDGADD